MSNLMALLSASCWLDSNQPEQAELGRLRKIHCPTALALRPPLRKRCCKLGPVGRGWWGAFAALGLVLGERENLKCCRESQHREAGGSALAAQRTGSCAWAARSEPGEKVRIAFRNFFDYNLTEITAL